MKGSLRSRLEGTFESNGGMNSFDVRSHHGNILIFSLEVDGGHSSSDREHTHYRSTLNLYRQRLIICDSLTTSRLILDFVAVVQAQELNCFPPTNRQPFKSSSGEYLTSRDLVDIRNQLGVDYSLGSFDKVWNPKLPTVDQPSWC